MCTCLFSWYKTIINGYKEEIEGQDGQLEERDDIKSKSKTTQAIKLFSEGKSPVDVAIALDLPADIVRAIHREFLELKGAHELVEVYDEIEDYLPSFLELNKIFHSRGLGRNEVLEILRIICTGELPYLQEGLAIYRIEWTGLKMKKEGKIYGF